jgi:hypothetical protein
MISVFNNFKKNTLLPFVAFIFAFFIGGIIIVI